MSEDRDRDAPSLEAPSLFGRKRRKASAAPAEPAEPVEPVEAAEPVGPVEPPEPVVPAEPIEPEEPVDDGPDTIFDDTSEPTPDAAPTQVPAAPKEPRPPRGPWLTGRPAVIVTALVVGLLIVAATAGSMRICTEIKGTSSCGGQGLLLLVAILVVSVLLGAAMLRAARVPEPGSTTFLAVGLLSVVTLLFLVGSIFEWWMAIVIPLVSVATFLLSHWVTVTFIDPANDGSDPAMTPEQRDLR
jgi:hypothetical protein